MDGRTDSAITLCLPKFLWGHKKRVYGSLSFELVPQQMSQSKKKYMDLCWHANKYKQVVLEIISVTFNGIQRVTYVTWAEIV